MIKIYSKRKFNNIIVENKVIKNGKEIIEKIHSKAEYRRYQELILLEKKGEIVNLERQSKFLLQDKFTDKQGIKHQAITYTPDFKYIENKTGKIIYEEIKSKGTLKRADYILRKKLFIKKLEDIKNAYFLEKIY